MLLPKFLFKVKYLGKRASVATHLACRVYAFTSETQERVAFEVDSPRNALPTCSNVLPLTNSPSGMKRYRLPEKAGSCESRVRGTGTGDKVGNKSNTYKTDSRSTGHGVFLEGERNTGQNTGLVFNSSINFTERSGVKQLLLLHSRLRGKSKWPKEHTDARNFLNKANPRIHKNSISRFTLDTSDPPAVLTDKYPFLHSGTFRSLLTARCCAGYCECVI